MQNLMATRRSNILNSAGDLFARRGYKAATIQQIAQEAHISVASLKGYYGDKQSIIHDIYSQLCGDIIKVLDWPVAGMGLTEYMAYIIDGIFNTLDQQKDIAWVLFTEQLPGMARARDDGAEAIIAHTGAMLSRLATLHMLDIDDIQSAAQLCYGNVHHAAVQWVKGCWDSGLKQVCASVLVFNLCALGRPIRIAGAQEALWLVNQR